MLEKHVVVASVTLSASGEIVLILVDSTGPANEPVGLFVLSRDQALILEQSLARELARKI